MKKSTIKSNRKFVFNCKEDAEKTLRYAKEIAQVYGHVTVADMCDFIGTTPTYVEYQYGWTPDAIERAEAVLNFDEGVYELYYFPPLDWRRDPEETDETNAEPINITISSNEWDTRRNDIEQVLNELLRNSDKIKDRPVFISIM